MEYTVPPPQVFVLVWDDRLENEEFFAYPTYEEAESVRQEWEDDTPGGYLNLRVVEYTPK